MTAGCIKSRNDPGGVSMTCRDRFSDYLLRLPTVTKTSPLISTYHKLTAYPLTDESSLG
jgi:hypothetical protein